MQQRRSRGDRVAAEHQGRVREFTGGDKAQSEGLGAGHRAVFDLGQRCLRCGGLFQVMAHLCGLTVRMARVECRQVGRDELFVARELALNPIDRGFPGLIEQPQHQPQRPEVLAAQTVLAAETMGLHRLYRQTGDVDLAHAEGVQTAVGEGIGEQICPLQALVRKRGRIDDDLSPGLQMAEVHDQRRGVEGDEHVGCVPGRGDAVAAELDLERGDAVTGTRRGANFCGEVRQGGEIVPAQGGGDRKLLALQLDTVPRVAGEPDHVPVAVWCATAGLRLGAG